MNELSFATPILLGSDDHHASRAPPPRSPHVSDAHYRAHLARSGTQVARATSLFSLKENYVPRESGSATRGDPIRFHGLHDDRYPAYAPSATQAQYLDQMRQKDRQVATHITRPSTAWG